MTKTNHCTHRPPIICLGSDTAWIKYKMSYVVQELNQKAKLWMEKFDTYRVL